MKLTTLLRPLLALAVAAGLSAAANSAAVAAEQAKQLRIGFQRSGPLLVLKQWKTLEQKLEPLGYTVTWSEFTAGPPLLEALNVGSIDLGTTGDTPPLFAQAAGTDLVYVGAVTNPGTTSAVLVQKDGPIQSIADLKGKKVAFVRGSNANNIIIRVLEKGGLTFKDIQPVSLTPADARAAFERGSIDAWAIWDPYYALAERSEKVRVLTSAAGIVDSYSFYLARRVFAAQAPEVVQTVIGEIARVSEWGAANPAAYAEILAKENGLPLDVQTVAAKREGRRIAYIDDEIVAKQQRIADDFHRLGLIPRAITIRDVIWTPPASPKS
jgi:sulfonate transport system substrate-binding protein